MGNSFQVRHILFSLPLLPRGTVGELGELQKSLYSLSVDLISISIPLGSPVPSIIFHREKTSFFCLDQKYFPSLKSLLEGELGELGNSGRLIFLRFPIGSRQFFWSFRPLVVLILIFFSFSGFPCFRPPSYFFHGSSVRRVRFICVCLCLSCLCWVSSGTYHPRPLRHLCRLSISSDHGLYRPVNKQSLPVQCGGHALDRWICAKILIYPCSKNGVRH